MSETTITFQFLYNAAREFYEKKDFNKAFDLYKAALQVKADYAVVWQEAGYTLMQMQRMAEAGIYFRKALLQYDQNENIDIPIDKKMYLKACLHAILEEKDETISHLKQAVELNPELLKKIINEDDFQAFINDEDFLAIITSHQYQNNHQQNSKKEREQAIQKDELSEEEIIKRDIVVEILQNENWNNTEIEKQYQENQPTTPQAMLFYSNNPNFEIYLSYYIQQNCIYLDLYNKNQRSENQICKFKINNLADIIQKILEAQDQISDDNWTDWLGEFIDICEEVTLEMPDGRQVKI